MPAAGARHLSPACRRTSHRSTVPSPELEPTRHVRLRRRARPAGRARRDAMDIVQFLQEFSVTAPDFSDLSELFSDDKRMAEAAVRAPVGILCGPSAVCIVHSCCWNADTGTSARSGFAVITQRPRHSVQACCGVEAGASFIKHILARCAGHHSAHADVGRGPCRGPRTRGAAG